MMGSVCPSATTLFRLDHTLPTTVDLVQLVDRVLSHRVALSPFILLHEV